MTTSPTPADPPVPASFLPTYVGVLGGGRMGSGIAHAFLMVGCNVTIVESDDGAAASAHSRVARAVEKSLVRKAGQQQQQRASASNAEHASVPATTATQTVSGTASTILRRLTSSTDYSQLKSCELVVEAVPENREIKVAALRRVEHVLDATAVLASNTSALSLTDLAAQLARPTQFLGLHFFNPVPASALIEIVRGQLTPDPLVTTAQAWVTALGKTAVVVKDVPGFASSRLGVALALEAMRMLEEGIASAEDIDAAMVLGYRHQTGPLRTTDLVGLDIRLDIAEHLTAMLGPRFAVPDILREKVARGELGRKTGYGFFDWT